MVNRQQILNSRLSIKMLDMLFQFNHDVDVDGGYIKNKNVR